MDFCHTRAGSLIETIEYRKSGTEETNLELFIFIM
jgi:hypothetical protein